MNFEDLNRDDLTPEQQKTYDMIVEYKAERSNTPTKVEPSAYERIVTATVDSAQSYLSQPGLADEYRAAKVSEALQEGRASLHSYHDNKTVALAGQLEALGAEPNTPPLFDDPAQALLAKEALQSSWQGRDALDLLNEWSRVLDQVESGQVQHIQNAQLFGAFLPGVVYQDKQWGRTPVVRERVRAAARRTRQLTGSEDVKNWYANHEAINAELAAAKSDFVKASSQLANTRFDARTGQLTDWKRNMVRTTAPKWDQ
jgi:hypothetical protein